MIDFFLIFVLPFAGMLATVVVIHELGHFMTAKFFDIHVEEFGLGFPPKIIGFRRGETLYSINLLPLGGFVRLAGENDNTGPRSFSAKDTGVRFLVLVAGPLMNLILPIIIFAIFFMVPQDVAIGDVTVAEVIPNSPASNAHIEPGDIIEYVNGHKIQNLHDLRETIMLNLGEQMTWQIRYGLGTDTVTVVPRWNWPEGQGPTGIGIFMANASIVSQSEPPWKAIPHAFIRVRDILSLMKNEITRLFIIKGSPQITGPIGIAQVTGEVAREGGVASVIVLAAIISLSLAILNILPIPALDGGRILFVAIEWLRRGKRISPQKEGLIHLIGFATLISLVVFVSYYDILRIIKGETLLH